MTAYGVWSWTEDGFVSEPSDSRTAHSDLNALYTENDEGHDLTVETACVFHPERRYWSCEQCEEDS